MSDTDALHQDPPEELSNEAPSIEGELPRELRGTLLRNGPGIQGAGKDRFHMLDGYGLVGAVRFDDGKATFRARHVRTPTFEKERAAGRMLKRKIFTNKPSRWSNLLSLDLANAANHDVYAWGGSVVAADAQGHFVLDAKTLETKGASPIDKLRSGATATLAQMPRPDPATGRLVVFSIAPGLGGDTLTFFELDANWNVVHKVKRKVEMGVVLHDHAVTENHYVAMEIGRLSVASAAWGAKSVFDSFELGPGGRLRLVVVPRHGDGKVRAFELPRGAQAFHVYNAFERGGELVVDVALYERKVDFNVLHPPGARTGIEAMQSLKPVATRCIVGADGSFKLTSFDKAIGDSPTVHPERFGRPHRFGYFAAQTVRGDEHSPGSYFYFHGLGKLDFDSGEVTTWSAGPRTFVSPPVFAPRPGSTDEDDGWLLSWTSDAEKNRASVVVLDAKRPADGPVATVHLGPMLPPVSHPEFAPEL